MFSREVISDFPTHKKCQKCQRIETYFFKTILKRSHFAYLLEFVDGHEAEKMSVEKRQKLRKSGEVGYN